MKKRIILIGGAPTAGKSTIAALLSKHLDIPWISTDQIREIMQSTVSNSDYQSLFEDRDISGEEFLNKYSAQEIVQKEKRQAEETWKGIAAFIRNAYPWKSFIIEGIAILPHLMAQDFSQDKTIEPVFLVDTDADRIRDVVFTRGLWDDARTYSDDIKEKEIEWVLLFSREIQKEAEKSGYPCIEVTKRESDLPLVLEVLT